MRMEKINDRQVRCMITAQDLEDRKLTLKELRYGSRETTALFHEMLNTASSQYGFNEDGLPIMIEAVPVSPEELMVIISAVEDAEELDPHFAQYAEIEEDPNGEQKREGFYEPDRIMDIIRACLISMKDIDEVISFCKQVGPGYPGTSELYRNSKNGGYYLALIRPEEMESRDYNVFLNSIMEYGEIVPGGSVVYAQLKEHETPVMQDPLKILGSM